MTKLTLVVCLLVCAATYFLRVPDETFGSSRDLNYWLGASGGLLLLTQLAYSLRKRSRAMESFGEMPRWLRSHTLQGISGATLIVLHSAFRIDSLNSAAAMLSVFMLVISGLVGQFLYARIHRGLDAKQQQLDEFKVRSGLDRQGSPSRLAFAPEVETLLRAFAKRHSDTAHGSRAWLINVFVLPLLGTVVKIRCYGKLRSPLRRIAARRNWSRGELARHEYLARKLVRRYVERVVRVAQFDACERLIAYWHLLHVPFVYILLVSGLIHVLAVHAY